MRILLSLFCFFFWHTNEPAVSVAKERMEQAKGFTIRHSCNNDYVIFIDMSVPSDKKRWYVVQLDSMKVIYSTYVAHGKGSGQGKNATKFSDVPGSYCTALGKYKITGSCYGEHGLSYILDGLEESNKNALSRSIIIHSAWYVSGDFVAKYDRCGSSWGCPAISAEALKDCKPYLKPGTLVWIYN
jgi:hypothetical protein